MNPGLCPLRAASLSRLLIVALLLSVLPASWPGQPAANDAAAADVAAAHVATAHVSARPLASLQAKPSDAGGQPAQVQPAAPQTGEVPYSVRWDIEARGREEYGAGSSKVVTTRKVSIKGAATILRPNTVSASAFPMQLTVTDDWYDSRYAGETQISITDPGRYNGGPDLILSNPYLFRREQGLGGAWTMDNPFSSGGGFVTWDQLPGDWRMRTFTYRTVIKRPNEPTKTLTNQNISYDDIFPSQEDTSLQGDATGTVFTLNRSYQVGGGGLGLPMTVSYRVTVTAGGGCEGLKAPVDISNPAIKMVHLNLQAEDTTPDGQATLTAMVTCGGLPVVNAPVELTMKVKDQSGGHLHSSANRPRGSIDGVEQGPNSKFIGLTKADGTVSFAIRPGKDLTNKTRGIAGLYQIDGKVEWPGLTTPTEHASVLARLNGLVRLPQDLNLYSIIPFENSVHTHEFYGTPATVEAVRSLAQGWLAEQALHNEDLGPGNAWPERQLGVLAISLPPGGLFDELASLGSGSMWRTPFQQHRTGQDVWCGIRYVGLPAEQQLWYVRAFREVGSATGTWFSDGTQDFHLRIGGGGAQSPARPVPGQGASNPDVAASAALLDPGGQPVAGAGQTVVYAVGVENLAAGTTASQVALQAALPAGLSFISADPAPSRMANAGTPVWDIGALAAEAVPRAFRVTAQVAPTTAAGSVLTVTATATTSSPDADPANDQFSAWGLTVQPPGPDLVISSNLSGRALTLGQPVIYTIGLRNEGNAPASGSWLTLTVPTGITIVASSAGSTAIPGGVRWAAGTLAPGQAFSATASVRVDPGLLAPVADPDGEPEYPQPFLMEADSEGSDIDPASNQMHVDKRVELPGPDLWVGLQAAGTPGPGVFEVGREVTYALRYANYGNQPAGQAATSLLLWPGLAFLGSQPAPATNQLNTTTGVRTLTWGLGELAVGQEGVIEVRLRVDTVPETGSIIRADITSDNTDLNPADNAVIEVRRIASSSPSRKPAYLPLIVSR